MEECDVIVIGGGIAGVGAAACLGPGVSVVLFEREEGLAYHTTGRSAAMLLDAYGNEVIRALTAASRPVFEAPDPEVWPGALTSPRGVLFLAEPGEEALAEQSARETPGGVLIGAAEAVDLVPVLRRDRVAAACHDRLAREIDVDLLFQGYVRELRSNGGRIVTRAEVTGLARDGAGWRVETSAGVWRAGVVVNAAGAWGDIVAGLAGLSGAGLKPLRRSAVMVPLPVGYDVMSWPLFASVREDWYARPQGGQLMVSPADEDEVEPHDAWAEDMVLAEGLDRYGSMVSVSVTRVGKSWAGLRTFAPDRTPVAGFDPRAPGFYWLAGQGGYGIQTAPALSRFAAGQISGRAAGFGEDLAAALSPSRFVVE